MIDTLARIELAAERLRDDADNLPAYWLIEITGDQPMHEQIPRHPLLLHGVADLLKNHAALCRATGNDPSFDAASVADLILGDT